MQYFSLYRDRVVKINSRNGHLYYLIYRACERARMCARVVCAHARARVCVITCKNCNL